MSTAWRRIYRSYDPELRLFRGDSYPPPDSAAGRNNHCYPAVTSVAEILNYGRWPDGAVGTPEVCRAAQQLGLPALPEQW